MGIEDILKQKLPPEEFRKHLFLYIYSHEPYTDVIKILQENPIQARLYQ